MTYPYYVYDLEVADPPWEDVEAHLNAVGKLMGGIRLDALLIAFTRAEAAGYTPDYLDLYHGVEDGIHFLIGEINLASPGRLSFSDVEIYVEKEVDGPILEDYYHVRSPRPSDARALRYVMKGETP